MNKDSVAARRIKEPSKLPETEGRWVTHPGDFAWEFDFTHFEHGAKETDQTLIVYIHLPGENHWISIHVRRGAAGGDRVWGWDGNLDAPTFTPSILNPEVWHGHMIAGRLESCP